MDNLDLDNFLNQTLFGMDVRTMLGGVEDFLSFSESNLSWQKLRELQRAEKEAAEIEFKGEDAPSKAAYRDHLIENATYRFDVSLNQRVRYAALTALVTTVDWCALMLQKRATFQFPTRPKKANLAVHILRTLNSKAQLDASAEIEQMESLIVVRNCVVHGAGLVEAHEHKSSLKQGLDKLDGMQLSRKNFLGESVEIEAGALESVISKLEKWLPELEKRCFEKGFIK